MKYQKLKDTGNEIPMVGLGTFALKSQHLITGINNGYKLLDTAWQYNNETEVGEAVRTSGIARENIFITTKIWTDDIRNGDIERAVDKSLFNLGMDYIDLYLIHWPAKGYENAWLKMLELQEKGKIKNTGVCNCNIHHLDRIHDISGIYPGINQVELHPFFQNQELVSFCKSNKILVQAWCPLGGPKNHYLDNDVFLKLGKKYNKSAAQIILRWHVQNGILVIPRSSNNFRQRENIDIFDFDISREDMSLIDSLDKEKRIGADPDMFEF